MSGVYKPIAGLSPDNQGPVNTVVAIILCSTTILFFTVRYAIGRKRLLHLDSDDIAFVISLCFGVTMSVMSQVSVGAGLGRHQDTLSPDQIERFFKLRWAEQILSIIALAFAKMSIVLMFRRIVPEQFAPFTLKILVPVTTLYAFICIMMVSFQCQLPRPWMLNPKTCSTHGNIYYASTVLNMLTDTLLAGWFLPQIWALQMDQSTKILVMSMFGSRIVVCAADAGRMVVIQRALSSDDQTWSQLLWAILDQVVVHLSINHATLPRVHAFLSNLQTGLLVTQITTSGGVNTNSKGSKRSRNAEDSVTLSGTDERERSLRWNWRQKLLKSDRHDAKKEGSISESPLRLQFDHDVELLTTIYADDDDSTPGRSEMSRQAVSTDGPSSLPRESLPRSSSRKRIRVSRKASKGGKPMTINVHKTVERTEEITNSPRRPNLMD